MSSRDPSLLTPTAQTLYKAWREGCRAAGIDVLVTCTLRTQAEQDALYAQGRTTPGKIVTWTRSSRHSLGEAWDFVPIHNGKPAWTATDPAWAAAGKIATDLGLEWGGNWAKGKRDLPHIQLP